MVNHRACSSTGAFCVPRSGVASNLRSQASAASTNKLQHCGMCSGLISVNIRASGECGKKSRTSRGIDAKSRKSLEKFKTQQASESKASESNRTPRNHQSQTDCSGILE